MLVFHFMSSELNTSDSPNYDTKQPSMGRDEGIFSLGTANLN
ncbi:MAG TPA: hypothetical protein VGK10_14445 [Prolixibacteraceae bacterium]|jgi:hypothetical protein